MEHRERSLRSHGLHAAELREAPKRLQKRKPRNKRTRRQYDVHYVTRLRAYVCLGSGNSLRTRRACPLSRSIDCFFTRGTQLNTFLGPHIHFRTPCHPKVRVKSQLSRLGGGPQSRRAERFNNGRKRANQTWEVNSICSYILLLK
jgi:hypothetical protein